MNGTEEWIEPAKRGDSEALAKLLQAHYAFLFKYLVKLTLHRQTAEDLAQDTMVRAIEKISLYDERRGKFSSWLMTIATRLYFDFKRKRQRETGWLIEATEEASVRHLKWKIEGENCEYPELIDVLARLPDLTRAVIVLKHYYGYSYEEIAVMTNFPVGTVKSRIHNGLASLRKEWIKDE
ncbi:MAG: RNA polymerase sigma factor SigY [Bacilli bacterium]